MAYYITIGNKNKIIDITKDNLFSKLSTFKTTGACSLKEIDAFSIQFNNEEELKQHLFMNSLLSEEDFDKKLMIKIKKNNTYSKVIYDLLYQKDAYYLSLNNLRRELMNRNYDYDFLDKFVRFFYNYYECRVAIYELGLYVYDSKRSVRSKYLDERYSEVIYKLMYSYNDINYKNIHTLIAFINNYDKKKEKEKEENTQLEVKPKVKSKTRKKEIIGQTSLFD